ncbi:hypothetical protein M9Y10_029790 [Tritrichomonas musculus]|uniref:Uncharacterized protein n=1 Tax=Tritrichomonas musculus TaxID=1915356 RepID=A0ABR2KNR6_9EUKA
MNTILNSYDNTEQYLEYEMKSQDEAISFLNTEFHERSIEYLSKHITELVSSSEICNIDEGIINDVIDAYISEEYDSDMIEYLGDETSEKLAFLFLKFVCLNYNSKVIQPLN